MAVQGIPGFTRKFTQLVPAIVEDTIAAEMARRAEDLVHDLRILAPVYTGKEKQRSDGSPIVPGALKVSIGWTFGRAPKGTIAIANSRARVSDDKVLRVTVFAGGGPLDAFYARWVEFGNERWAGHPFFFPTYQAHRRRIKGGITRALRKAIKKANEA